MPKNISYKLLVLLVVFLAGSNTLIGQEKFTKRFDLNIEKFNSIDAFQPFELSEAKKNFSNVKDVTNLQISKTFIKEITTNSNELLKVILPLKSDQNITLLLEPAKVLSDNFKISYASGKAAPSIKKNKYFWGKVEGSANSLVSFSVSQNEVVAIISIDKATYNLGKETQGDEYVIYEKSNHTNPPTHECYSEDILDFKSEEKPESRSYDPNSCVDMYVEIDNDLYLSKGSGTADYVAAIFSQVSLLYSNDAINLQLGELLIWDSLDPYNGPTTSDYLTQFRTSLNGSYNGSLAHLVGLNGRGGIAYIDVLCNSVYGVGYSGIGTGYSEVPTYSWTVEVLTHEIGHNLGSPHTHSCSWNGNNTQIDDCGNIYLANNNSNPGSCYDPANQTVPASGTIMSYCHLLSGVGIDFTLGFGTQPGDLLRSNVYSGACLSSCGSACDPGVACDDFDACTIGDTYDVDCNCIGLYSDLDGDGVCDSEDQCPGFDDLADIDGDGIPNACDDCINEQTNFANNNLIHSGSGSSSNTVSFSNYVNEVNFRISNINSKDNGNPGRRFKEKVVVTYVDGGGSTKIYGTYLGSETSTVDVSISGTITSVTVTLSNDYNNNSTVDLIIDLSQIDTCPTEACPDGDDDGVCDTDDICPNGDDSIDVDQNGIPDACDSACQMVQSNFSTSTLTQTGSSANMVSLNFGSNDIDPSFTITGLGSKINGNPSNRYIDRVRVDFINGAGILQTYGLYRGDEVNSVSIQISGNIQELMVYLDDAYDGTTNSTIAVELSDVEFCSIPETSESVLGLSDESYIVAYPNPFVSEVNVQIKDEVSKYFKINVFDASGKRILNPATYHSNKIQLDLSSVDQAGVYFIKIETDTDRRYFKRVIYLKN